jgi:single-strand DNA-binding protein
MARGVNLCMFIGYLGKDCEVRYQQSGAAIVNFSIAVNESWKDQGGQQRERTEWINVVIFGRLGEALHEYLLKCTQVYVEGKFRTEKWKDKEGNDRYTVKIYADKIQLLSSQQRHQGGGRPSREEPPARNERRGNRWDQQRQQPPDDGFDDDIPF